MTEPDTPQNPATLATVPGAYLWRHFRFEYPLPGSPAEVKLRPSLLLLTRKANLRVEEAAKIRTALARTRSACEELIAQLDEDDTLRGSRHVAYDPNEMVSSLKRRDDEISEIVAAIIELKKTVS